MPRLYPLLTLLVLSLLPGCEKKKYPPQLTSVTPTAAPIGADITLTGSQFGDAPTVVLGGQNVTTKTRSDNAITLTVPRMAVGPTTVTVQNADGSSGPMPFTVQQPQPQLTGVEPGNGLPATSVRIRGDFLDKLKAVRFGNTTAEMVSGGSVSEVTVKVPQMSRGPVKLTLETEGGQSQTDFIVAATPEITGFSPAKLKVGDELTITGRNLLDGVISLNGVPVDKTLTQVQDTQIKLKVPQSVTTGRITVTVFDKLVASSSQNLEVVPTPIVNPNGLSVTEGIEGDKITLTGQNLGDVTAVSFGGTGAAMRVISPTQVEATVPRRSTSGEVEVGVSSLGGSSVAPQKFLIILAPADLNIDPDRQGRTKEVTVKGRNLHRITSAQVNGKSATITGRSEGSELKLTVPADATTGKLTLTNRAGEATTSRNLTVVLKPQVTEYTTKAAIGGWVTVKGQFLLNARVFFKGTNGGAEIDNNQNTDTEIRVKVPNDATDGPIRVWNNESGEYFDTGDFTVLRAPVIASISPSSGTRGSEVTITGQSLDEVTEVRFNGGNSAPAQILTPRSSTQLRVSVPGNAVDGTICLKHAQGNTCSSGSFNVILPPSIDRIEPAQGLIGTPITIYGSNLANVQELKLGDRTVQVNAGSDNGRVLITCPAFTSVQTVGVTVRTAGGTSNPKDFRGAPAPTIEQNRCTPTAVSPGWTVTLRGTNFNTVSQVRFTNGVVNRDQFLQPIVSNEITLKVPANTQTGNIQLVNEYGTGPGVNFDKDQSATGLNPENITTNVGSLITGSISDNCVPRAFGYCMNGSCLIYTVGAAYAEGSDCKNCKPTDQSTVCKQCKECNDRSIYTIESQFGSQFHVFKPYYQTPQTSLIKFERTSDDKAYTGFVIFVKDGVTYMGNILKSDGSIGLKSVATGADLKLCKVVSQTGQSTFLIGSNLSNPCLSVRCEACK